MARKTIGFTELEWTCPNCMTKNPGTQKICSGCGAPQPESVKFEQRQVQQFIEDEEKIKAALAGADFHCGFCGARNAVSNKICTQCGGDLTGAKQRLAGHVLGAFQEGEIQQIKCPHCEEVNPETNAFCNACGGSLKSQGSQSVQTSPAVERVNTAQTPKKTKLPLLLILGAGALLVLCITLILALTSRKDTLIGTVQNVSWSREVEIEEYGPVTRDDWIEDIPADAILGNCSLEYHHTQDQPAPNSEEICGTPYTIDSGTGVGQVVQDCEYRVYQEFCEYRIDDWYAIDTLFIEGSDLSPAWPDIQLPADQRFGDSTEDFSVFLLTDDGIIEYDPETEQEFIQFRPGTEWELATNTFGAIIDIEPLN